MSAAWEWLVSACILPMAGEMSAPGSVVTDLPSANLLLAGAFDALNFDLEDQGASGKRMVAVELRDAIANINDPKGNLLTAITGSNNLSADFNTFAGRQFLKRNFVHTVWVTLTERMIG